MRKLSILALLWLAAGITVSTVSLHAADTLKIGMVAAATGADAESGRYQRQGAELASPKSTKQGAC